MKRILSVFLTALLLLSLASCGSGMSDGEIREIYRELVEASYTLNDVYYGDGLPFVNDPETMASLAGVSSRYSYMPVAKTAPYQSEAEIRQATEAVFSKTLCEHLFVLAFEGMSTENEETVVFARYIEQDEILTVRIDLADESLPMGRTYDFDSMTIISQNKNRITASFETEMNGEKSVNVKLTLIKEEKGWRLDSPTY